jgi:hypothetical protein
MRFAWLGSLATRRGPRQPAANELRGVSSATSGSTELELLAGSSAPNSLTPFPAPELRNSVTILPAA